MLADKRPIEAENLKSAVEAIAFSYLTLNDSGLVQEMRFSSQDGRVEYFPVLGGTVEQLAYVSDLASYVETSVMQAAINARGLPAGGTTGQVLAKSSGTDYAVSWSTIDLSTKQDAAAFLTTLVGIGGTTGTGNLVRASNPTLGSVTCDVLIGNSYISVGSGGGYTWQGKSQITSPSDATLLFRNTFQTIGAGLDFGTDNTLKIRNRAMNADGALTAGAITASGLASINTGAASGFALDVLTANASDSGIRIRPQNLSQQMKILWGEIRTNLGLMIGTDANDLRFFTGAALRWDIKAAGHFFCGQR